MYHHHIIIWWYIFQVNKSRVTVTHHLGLRNQLLKKKKKKKGSAALLVSQRIVYTIETNSIYIPSYEAPSVLSTKRKVIPKRLRDCQF